MNYGYTTNSHYITYTFLFERLGEFLFLILGVKGLNSRQLVGLQVFAFLTHVQVFQETLSSKCLTLVLSA